MIEGSDSVHLIDGSGSRKPKNIRLQEAQKHPAPDPDPHHCFGLPGSDPDSKFGSGSSDPVESGSESGALLYR